MFHPARATAAAAYLGSLIFALFAAFFGGRLRYPLVLISLVVEVLACTFLVLLCWCAFCLPCLFAFCFLHFWAYCGCDFRHRNTYSPSVRAMLFSSCWC